MTIYDQDINSYSNIINKKYCTNVMKNNQSIRSYSNITNYDKVTRSNDVMKNNQQIKTPNITNNDRVTRYGNNVLKKITLSMTNYFKY